MPPKKKARWGPGQGKKKVIQEKKKEELRVQFPVSSGSQHRKIEETQTTGTTQTQTWPQKNQVISQLSRPWKGNNSLSKLIASNREKKNLSGRLTQFLELSDPPLSRLQSWEQSNTLSGRPTQDWGQSYASSSRLTLDWEEKDLFSNRPLSWGQNNIPSSRLAQNWEENSSLSSRPTQNWEDSSLFSGRSTQNWEDSSLLASRSSQNWEENCPLSSRSTLAWGSHPPSGRGTDAWEQYSEPTQSWEQNYSLSGRPNQNWAHNSSMTGPETQGWEQNRFLTSRPPPNWDDSNLLANHPDQSWEQNDSQTNQQSQAWDHNSLTTNRPPQTWEQGSLSTPRSAHAWEQESLTRQSLPSWEERDMFSSRQTWSQNNQMTDRMTSTTMRMTRSYESLDYPNWANKESLRNYGPSSHFNSSPYLPTSKHFGMRMLQKMGWTPGEGLGKNKEGMIEPLMPDANVDSTGVYYPGGWNSEQKKNFQRKPRKLTAKDLSGKHPVSGLIELCTNRSWPAPVFEVVTDVGPIHKKTFIMKVTVNGRAYTGKEAAASKKVARANAATVCLQSLGLMPKKRS